MRGESESVWPKILKEAVSLGGWQRTYGDWVGAEEVGMRRRKEGER